MRDLLTQDIAWHEPGGEDYSGDTVGREEVLILLANLSRVTGGTFRLEPTQVIATDGHAAAADKKRRSGRPAFVVPVPGGAALLDGVDLDEALACLRREVAVG